LMKMQRGPGKDGNRQTYALDGVIILPLYFASIFTRGCFLTAYRRGRSWRRALLRQSPRAAAPPKSTYKMRKGVVKAHCVSRG
jgi:hypothetical protein